MGPRVSLDTVGVIGFGCLRLPTSSVLAHAGKTVIGVDVKQSSVNAIDAGQVSFVEEGLRSVLAGVVVQGKLSARLETLEADAYIVSVPASADNGRAETSMEQRPGVSDVPERTHSRSVRRHGTRSWRPARRCSSQRTSRMPAGACSEGRARHAGLRSAESPSVHLNILSR